MRCRRLLPSGFVTAKEQPQDEVQTFNVTGNIL